MWLFVAALHKNSPSFVCKAYVALDTAVGRDRLPQFSDRPNLTFMDAIVHELFRWRPISPGSIPRRVDKEDEVGGIKIAKNTTIMANAWAVGRDEAVFDPALGDLHDFNPERWLREGMTAADQAMLRYDVP